MSQAKRVAIITGASSGVGAEFCRQLAQMRAADELWLIARREAPLRALAAALDLPCVLLAGDVTEEDWQQRFAARLQTLSPCIALLVNSAGFGKHGLAAELGDYNEAQIRLNCEALTLLCRLCIPYMISGGRIINLASVAAFMPQANFAVYAASKAYVLSFSRALHRELKQRGITVTAVCPNPMETEFFDVAGVVLGQSNIKKIGVEKVDKVVHKALRRSQRGKDISVYSPLAQAIRLAARLLPHPFVLWLEGKIGF